MTIKQSGALSAALALAGCASGALSSAPPSAQPTSTPAESPIKHVVFVIQENRSFNNLFVGYPDATTQNYGLDTGGHRVPLAPRNLGTSWDINHSSTAFFTECDGRGKLPGTDCRMDGWNREEFYGRVPKNAAYSYVRRKQIEPYWQMARDYVLADRTFSSNLDGSFVSHQYAVAAYASHAVDFPLLQWGCPGGRTDTLPTLTSRRALGPPIPACFDNPTIASEADTAGVSWRFYADALNTYGGPWSAYQADREIYRSPDWQTNVINPETRFLEDVAKGRLAAITWITPTLDDSDHPGLATTTQGPAWVASVVNAVGASRFWNSTAIFVMWDDWGGFFDPVPPVHEDYDGLGFRVPLLMISPYAKRRSVTHVQYETASVLRFIEDNFGLAPLAASDARAADPAADPAAFDYRQAPRTFEKISGSRPAAFWHERQHDASAIQFPFAERGGD
ncbi:MAG: hypothetical protein JOZ77_09125 [Candidatus Eremiobacteraeota bacterium]|nr:hypothetical protein [Candidatus Eremiobacteraeota bacterium]